MGWHVVLSNGNGPCGSEEGAEDSSDSRLLLFEVVPVFVYLS